MAENETTFEKTLLVAVKVESKGKLEWLTPLWVAQTLALGAGIPPDVRQAGPQAFDVQGLKVNEHSCTKVAGGSVEAPFKRIDALEERLVTLVEKMLEDAERRVQCAEVSRDDKESD
jgi:hypothetical protein